MGRILDIAMQFFTEDGWPYHQVEERSILKTGFEGKNGQFTCYAQERSEQEQFVFYSVFPVHVPHEQLMAAGEFVNRANYGMIIGNFELDYSDGEVRYKTSVDVEGAPMEEEMLRHLIYANVLTLDKYFSGFMRLIYAGIAAEDAIREVEGE